MGQATSPHRAEDLAAGYTRAQHLTNIGGLLVFGTLSVYCAYRIVATASAEDTGWLALATLLGIIVADVLTGIVHWACDSWGKPDSWVFGKVFIRSFREHHVDEKAITRHPFVQTNGEQTLAGFPMLLLLLYFGADLSELWSRFCFCLFFHVIFWAIAANQFHKWAHQDDAPALANWLMRARLIIGRERHKVHHTAPYTTYYCMVTGWMNEPLHRIRFFRALEHIVHKLTGALPREDDLGREVAQRLLDGDLPGTDPTTVLELNARVLEFNARADRE